MRIIEIALFGIFVLAGIGLMPILIPGQVFPTGDSDLNFIEKMNMSELEAMKPTEDASLVDQANYFFNLAVKAVFGAADMVFSILFVIPALGETFHINSTLMTVIGVGVFALGVIGWIQFTKGDSFEGKR